MSDGSFPSSPPPPPPVTPIVTPARAWWQSWWLLTALVVLLVVGAAALIASTTGGDDDGADDGRATPPTEPVTTDPPTSDPPDDPVATDPPTSDPPVASDPDADPPPSGTTGTADTTDPSSTTGTTDTTDATDGDAQGTAPVSDTAEVEGAPPGTRGDRDAPVAAGDIADLGEGWRLQVLGITEDATEPVLAENQFNDAPRPGTKYTFVRIALGYYGLDDPASAFVPSISGLAAGSVELDDRCGVIPDDFRTFADVFTGGVLTGNLCFVTTPADDGTVRLYATTTFGGPEVFAAADGPDADLRLPVLSGPQPGAASTPDRLAPVPIGSPVDVGEGWTLTVTGPATDLTDVIAAENQFNDPPPDGFRFVGIDVEYVFAGQGPAQAIEVGTKMVGRNNVELVKGCGVIPDPVDVLADVFEGGSVAGALCFITPVDEVGTLVLYASTGFDDEPVFFDTGGSASASPG